jgi:hypothetical protein
MPTPEEIAAEEARKKADADRNAELQIPKSRFDEVNNQKKDLEARLAAAEEANRKAEEARLKERDDYKGLYEKTTAELAELKPKAAIAEEVEKTLKDVLAAQVLELPEHVRDMVPEELTTQGKLKWLSTHKAKLMKPKAPDIGAGNRGGGAPVTTDLTPEEVQVARMAGMTAEEYAKNK